MGILRKASVETKQIMLDETDFIVVNADLSKKEFNALASVMPQGMGEDNKLDLPDAIEFQRYLFGALVIGWSLSEGRPTVDDYDGLSTESASAIDEAVADHFGSLLPSSAEGK